MESLSAQEVDFEGHEGDRIRGYLATPGGDGPFGGVVVIHHLPGYDRSTREITRRLAAGGFAALCPNLYSREAVGGVSDQDAPALVRAAGGVSDARLVGDVAGAARKLASLAASNGRIGVIGFCSGGRQAFLAACELSLDAAVDCYGAYVVAPPGPDSPLRVEPLVSRVDSLSCRLLGLFGAEDAYPSPAEVEVLAEALRAAGKDFDFHTFQGAGHAFFDPDRASYRPQAAVEGWRLVTAFFSEELGG